jgi:Dak1 domain
LQAKRNRDFARLREAQGRVISFTKENQVLLKLEKPQACGGAGIIRMAAGCPSCANSGSEGRRRETLMKKFLNEAVAFVDEKLDGIYLAHPQMTFVNDDKCCIAVVQRKSGKVGIATGGGSGHLPLFLGYVGKGMLNGAAVGVVFQSPSAEQMKEVTKAIDQGAGVLYIYGNYSGDPINCDMAAEMSDLDGIAVKQVVGNDDVASSVVGEEHKRRGVAGIFFVFKAAGAAAAEGLSLDEVTRVADKARARTRAVGVALSSCVPCPRSAMPPFRSARTRWKSAWGSMASPASAARRWPRPTRSSRR